MQLEGPHYLHSGTDCIGFAETQLFRKIGVCRSWLWILRSQTFHVELGPHIIGFLCGLRSQNLRVALGSHIIGFLCVPLSRTKVEGPNRSQKLFCAAKGYTKTFWMLLLISEPRTPSSDCCWTGAVSSWITLLQGPRSALLILFCEIIHVSLWKKNCALSDVSWIMCESFNVIPFMVFEFYAHRVSHALSVLLI